MSLATMTSLRRSLQEWAQREGHQKFLRDDQAAQLRSVLGNPNRRTQANVAAWMLGTWHLGYGMLRVLEGDADGFDEARIGQGLRRASLLSRARHQQGPRRGRSRAKLPFSLLHGAWTALLGLALDDPGAEPLYELLLAQPDIAFSEKDHLPFFTRELLALRNNRRPNMSSRLGIYEDVILQWNGDARLFARHLQDMLDVHLDEAQRAGATFDDPALRLYPVEVIALRNVRDWLELPTPKVDHALMHGNLGQMSPRTAWPQHDLLQRLERDAGGR